MKHDAGNGKPRAGGGPVAPLALALSLVAALPAGAAQMTMETFAGLRRGMHESEVLLRAGPPDLVTSPQGDVIVLGDGGIGSAVRELHYVPDASEHDPQLTVVTIRGGRVSALERRKITAPRAALHGAPPGPDEPVAPAPRNDMDVLRERADRTLDAAERYAEVRARIKARDAEPPAPARKELYRGVDEQGAPYFGDVPPRGADGAAR